MRAPGRSTGSEWHPIPDPDGRFSSGVPAFDRLLGGGFKRGSMVVYDIDESVGVEDLDLILFPTFLNFLYQSRGMVGILPSRDSPHEFRARLTRYVTRRRFDSRVRIFDYVGEDRGLSYVVGIGDPDADILHPRSNPKLRKASVAKAVAAEKTAQGGRSKPFIELVAFEVFDTLLGSENATKAFFHGIKRVRQQGNLGLGILGPGLGCAAGVRRMADVELSLHREDVGLMIRGLRPQFSRHVVATEGSSGPPHVAFVPPTS